MKKSIALLLVLFTAQMFLGCEPSQNHSECFLADNWNLSPSSWEHWAFSYQIGKNYFLARFVADNPDSTIAIIVIPGDSLCFKSKAFSNPNQKYSIRSLSGEIANTNFSLEELLCKSRFVIDNEIQEIGGGRGIVSINLMRDEGFYVKADNESCINYVRKDKYHAIGGGWYVRH